MSRHTHFILLGAVSLLINGVSCQSPSSTSLEPLASKHFTWPNIPYQVTGDQGGERGPQAGYNLCNSSTENQQSMCQTAFLNNLGDFCMWSSGQTNDTIGESEAREVAWCTSPGHGTRVIPPGAITGAQWLYARNYLQVVGFIDQTNVGLVANDAGGELDPHGADEQGNPLGGIVFTNGFGMDSESFRQLVNSGNLTGNQNYAQVIEWIDFIGNGVFCLKMCNPDDPEAPELCQHIYDEIGCTYNALADYSHINGTFQVCDSDDMSPPGVFSTNGQLTTWVQPQNGPLSPPYTPTIPASSNCATYSSEQLFAAAATDTAAGFTITSSASASRSASGSSRGSTGTATSTGSNSAAVGTLDTTILPFFAIGFFTMAATVIGVLA